MNLNKKNIINRIKCNEINFLNLPENLRNDKDVLLESIKIGRGNFNPFDFGCLINDEMEMMMQIASDKFKDDKDVMLEVVKEKGLVLEFVSDRLKDDKDIVLEAVKNNGEAFKFASERMRDNKEIIKKVINNHPYYFKYMSDKVKKDMDVVKFVINSCIEGMCYLDESLVDSKKVMLLQIEKWGKKKEVWDFYDEKFQDDKDIIIAGIKKNIEALKHASERLKDDKEVVLEAVRKSEVALNYVSKRLRDNKEVVLEAVSFFPKALIYVCEELQNDKDCLIKLEKVNYKNSSENEKKWYQERMEVLASIREKELMEKEITSSNILSKKLKF